MDEDTASLQKRRRDEGVGHLLVIQLMTILSTACLGRSTT